MFGRRRKKRDTDDGAAESAETVEQHSTVRELEKESDTHRAQGPWDSSEEVPDEPRLDLGGIQVPHEAGIDVQVNVAQQQNRIIGVTLVHGNSAVQVRPFAAPKSSGLWDEMREELREQVIGQGGKVEDFDGTFGAELRAVVPVEGQRSEEGHQLGQRVRFIGVDGPRWVLCGVIRGDGAANAQDMAKVEEIFQRIVVVRGDHPIPPREMLEIRVPQEHQEALQQAMRDAQQPGPAPGGGE